MRLPRYLITVAAIGALYAGVAIAQDSTVDKSKTTDSSKPETAHDDQKNSPETATDDPPASDAKKAQDAAKQGVQSNTPPTPKP